MGAYLTADPDTRVITITRVPVNGLSSLDVAVDIYSALKEDWQSTPALQGLRFPLRSFGDPKTPEQAIGPYVFLANDEGWRIEPYDADHELTINGNIVPEDVTLPLWKARIGRSILILEEQSAQALTTVKELVDIQYSSFEGGVTVDETAPSPSNLDHPAGTPRQPINNIPDAVSIRTASGLPAKIYFKGDYSFDAGDTLDGYLLIGENVGSTTFTIAPGADIQNCEINDAYVTGTLDGNNTIVGGHVHDVNYVDGHIEECICTGTVTLSGSSELHIIDSVSGIIGTGTFIIDCGGAGTALAMRGYRGGVLIRNKTGPESVSIDLASGQCRLDVATITDGTIVVRGVGKCIDDATGLELVSGPLPNGGTLINETVSGVRQSLIETMLRAEVTVDPATGLASFKDASGTKIMEWPVHKDAAGAVPYDGLEPYGIEHSGWKADAP